MTDPAPPSAPGPTPPAPITDASLAARLLREVEEKMNGYKGRASQLEQDLAAEKAARAADKTEADHAVGAARSAGDARLVARELKALATAAGIVDLDGLKLVDATGLKVTDAGDVEGAQALIDKLKTDKPHLFKNSTTGGNPPSPTPPTAKNAKDMTADEYRAARRQLVSAR